MNVKDFREFDVVGSIHQHDYQMLSQAEFCFDDEACKGGSRKGLGQRVSDFEVSWRSGMKYHSQYHSIVVYSRDIHHRNSYVAS